MTKTEKLKKILETLNDSVSVKDFQNSFRKVIKIVKKRFDKLEREIRATSDTEKEKLKKLQKDFTEIITEAKKESDSTLGGFKARTMEAINSLFTSNRVNQKLSEKLNEVSEAIKRVSQFKQARDGVDGINGIDGVSGQDGKDGSPDTPEQIADKLEELKGKDKLKISAIRGLKKTLKGLEARPVGATGAGVGKLALEARIIDWTLLGTGDGTTTDFTLPVTPNPTSSLQLKVGGGELFVTDDWTLSGRVVSFITAPPNTAKIRYKCRK